MTTSAYKMKQVGTKKAVFTIFTGLCKGCGLCMQKCPVKTLVWSDDLGVYGTPTVQPRNEDECTACGMCALVCPDCAILIERKPKA
ncbi:MAG: 4Fe-4S binding protein [Peptococcaceae bacterium]|nr:4Fe-4S binding protein [Peptococcaceae bacterium]MDH7523865.1 4Fe-4S binding protein [Peptococcaceae bacterium]